MTEEHENESSFNFGEYISPNPKPIPLGRFKPEPAVSYQIKKIVKYPDDDSADKEERKEQSEETSTASFDLKRGDSVDESVDSMNFTKSLESEDSARDCKPRVTLKNGPCTATKRPTKPFSSSATPAKVKVKKQAKEIELLQAEVRRLQFENNKLRSQSTSPQNEEDKMQNPRHRQYQAASKRAQQQEHHGGDSVSFNPSVDIVSVTASLKNTTLHDKVSLVRSNRNATPYKTKPARSGSSKQRGHSGHVQAEAKVVSATVQQRRGHKVEIKPLSKGKGCSRNQYRITPIPTKKKKSTKFKSKLQSIKQSEKENLNCSNIGLEDTALTPKDVNRLKKYATPSQGGSKGQNLMSKPAEERMSKSFDFGRPPPSETPSEVPSFLGGSSSLGSSFMQEATPEFMNQKLVLQGQGQGASAFTTPILTPTRGAEPPDSKPFSFDWNKKK